MSVAAGGMEKSEELEESGKREAKGPDLRSVFSIGLLTLLSRVLGLLRESTRAFFLGTGLFADAFQMAFQIPNMLRSLVAEGAVSSAVVPVLTRYERGGDKDELEAVREKYLFAWFLLVAVVTLAGFLLCGYLLSAVLNFNQLAEPGKVELTVELTKILFCYLLFIGLAASFQGILHAHGSFTGPAFSPILFNLVFIATGWLAAPYFPGDEVYVFAGAVILGGMLQFSLLASLVWKLGVRPRLQWPVLDHPGVRDICKLFLPVVFGAGIYQINIFLSSLLAWRFEDDGYVSALGYSSRLMEVVLGVFVFALNTVSLTTLSRLAADEDDEGFADTLGLVLRLSLFITVPSAVGLYLLRQPIVSMLFQSGQFDESSLGLTADAFQFHIIGLCFVGLSRVLVSAFYAMKNIKTPVLAASLNLLVCLPLAWWLSSGPMGYTGIALAASIAAIVQVLLLLTLLRSRVRCFDFGALLRSLAGCAICSVLMGGAVWQASRWLALESGAYGKPALIGLVLTVILAAAAVYFLLSRLFRMEEGAMLLKGLRRRRS